tara:strand:+ start:1483 stop:2043 length:561 start_codon:yes stop_codon:yes gene_type:complete
MKKLIYFLSLTCFFGFSQNQVNVEESSVKWTGTQLSGKSHYGTLSFKSADLSFSEDKLVGGNFIVDMTSLSVDDLTGKGKTSLEGHLKADDFFSVNDFNFSELKLNNVAMVSQNEYSATGNLTIKGYTHEAKVSFYTKEGSKNMMAKLVFDRSKYDVRYGSGSFFENLGDKLILDDIELEVTLVMM